ncbi:MAG: hypothetical protein MJZ74_07910 [Muribaculaceae bacterium]|nr:hypothetical protein [Muribaculaceae bacterium]
MNKIIAIALAVVALVGCSPKNEAEKSTEEQKSNVLVLYYSQTGATKYVAEELTKQLNADLEEVLVETNPYDGTYEHTIERCKREMASGEVPTMKPLEADLSQYDVIFIGYPVWFGTYARPIAGLVKNVDFKGKKVVTFCTFGSGGLKASTADLKKALPEATVVEGYGVRNMRYRASTDEIERFLVEGGYKKGNIEALPAFMEQHPVNAEERTIFNNACSGYKFPLGTPVTVAGRTTPEGTEYLYTVDNTDADGKPFKAQIKVIVPKENGAQPVFTQVERI